MRGGERGASALSHLHIKVTGHIVRHALGVLLMCWLRAFRAGAIAGIAGFVAVEIAGSIAAHQFPAPSVTHLLAVALGGALAYGAGITVVADELIVGIVDGVRLLMGETEAGSRAVVATLGHEVGDVRGGILRLLGVERLPRSAGRDHPSGLSPETLAELAALAPTVLRRRVDARPVQPGELSAAAPATTPLAPDAVAPATIPLPVDTGVVAATETAGLAAPMAWRVDNAATPDATAWHDPRARRAAEAAEAEDAEEAGIRPVDLFGAPPPTAHEAGSDARVDEPLAPPPPVPRARPLPSSTRPLAENTRPLDPRGSMWDHIGQMLAGRPIEPLPDDPTAPAETGGDG